MARLPDTAAALPVRELKFAPCDLKGVAADGTFAGYAALFEVPDLGNDVIAPGAFARSLAERGSAGVKLLYQHDPAEPIGVWLELREDARGLHARGRLMPEVARAREVLALMRAGALDGLSIGFRTVRGARDASTGLRRLEHIDLWEISVVTFPMQPLARISTVKGQLPSKRELERWLTRDAGLSRGCARALLAQGFQALERRRDAGPERAPDHLLGLLREAARRLNHHTHHVHKGI